MAGGSDEFGSVGGDLVRRQGKQLQAERLTNENNLDPLCSDGGLGVARCHRWLEL